MGHGEELISQAGTVRDVVWLWEKTRRRIPGSAPVSGARGGVSPPRTLPNRFGEGDHPVFGHAGKFVSARRRNQRPRQARSPEFRSHAHSAAMPLPELRWRSTLASPPAPAGSELEEKSTAATVDERAEENGIQRGVRSRICKRRGLVEKITECPEDDADGNEDDRAGGIAKPDGRHGVKGEGRVPKGINRKPTEDQSHADEGEQRRRVPERVFHEREGVSIWSSGAGHRVRKIEAEKSKIGGRITSRKDRFKTHAVYENYRQRSGSFLVRSALSPSPRPACHPVQDTQAAGFHKR